MTELTNYQSDSQQWKHSDSTQSSDSSSVNLLAACRLQDGLPSLQKTEVNLPGLAIVKNDNVQERENGAQGAEARIENTAGGICRALAARNDFGNAEQQQALRTEFTRHGRALVEVQRVVDSVNRQLETRGTQIYLGVAETRNGLSIVWYGQRQVAPLDLNAPSR